VQHVFYHSGDSALLRRAIAHDGLFDFARRDFANLKTCLGNSHQAGAPGFAQDERGLEVLSKNEPFDNADRGMMLAEDFAESLSDQQQTLRTAPTGRDLDCSLSHQLRLGPCRSDDAVACATK